MSRARSRTLMGWKLFAGVAALAASLVGCGPVRPTAPASRTTPSALEPMGESARIISEEWWFLFSAGSLVFVGVMALLGFIIARRRRDGRLPQPVVELGEPGGGLRWIWGGGIILPLVVLSAVFAMSLHSLSALSAPPQREELTIEVIGHRWWWEVRYPDAGVTTANQLHVPVGVSVRVNLTSADVIHSFWVPEVQHKRDLIPGETQTIWLQVSTPGVYRGICAEFCGEQHALMHFLLVAQPPDRYEAWLERERQPAATPASELALAGQQVFLSSSCIHCHTVRGTPAAGWVGPDLTHLASRYTLAAGIIDNNRGNLGGWITDPQHIKPGSLMPATELSGPELQALLAYLESLE